MGWDNDASEEFSGAGKVEEILAMLYHRDDLVKELESSGKMGWKDDGSGGRVAQVDKRAEDNIGGAELVDELEATGKMPWQSDGQGGRVAHVDDHTVKRATDDILKRRRRRNLDALNDPKRSTDEFQVVRRADSGESVVSGEQGEFKTHWYCVSGEPQ